MNTLFYGDNLDILREYIGDASVDIVAGVPANSIAGVGEEPDSRNPWLFSSHLRNDWDLLTVRRGWLNGYLPDDFRGA